MYRQNFPDDPGLHRPPLRRRYQSSRQSIRERIKNGLVGFVVGICILAVASVLIFWNEGRAVQTAKSLEEGLRLVRSLKSIEVSFSENDDKLVYLTGPLKTAQVLHDPIYDLAINAVKLRRNVKMYQWEEEEIRREHRDSEGNTQTEISYSYVKVWKSDISKSSSFQNPYGHENPEAMPFKTETQTAKDVQVGGFFLSEALTEKVNVFKQYNPTVVPKSGDIKIHLGTFYHGYNPESPQVGDMRVSFEYAGYTGPDSNGRGPRDIVSIIAKQKGNQLTLYETDAGDHLQILYMGEQSPHKIIGQEQVHNTFMTWGIRFVGWLLMFIGFGCLTRIITGLVDTIPVIGELVSLGVTTLNLTLAISLSLTVIALGWIRYRPLLGVTILGCAAFPFLVNRPRGGNRQGHRESNRDL